MIQIQVSPLKYDTAILASILIPLKDVMPGKFDLLFWESVEEAKQDYTRDSNPKRNRVY